MARKDPGLAVVFSILFPGMGHFYVEQFLWGVLWLIILVVSLLFPPATVVLWIVMHWHAYRLAKG